MVCFVAFLRGVNVGGKNKVPMAELRTMCEDLGFTDVKTILQSGNLVFCTQRSSSAALESLLEKEAEKRFGVSIAFMIRSAEELEHIVENNPLAEQAKADSGHTLVLFLKSPKGDDEERALREAIKGREVVFVRGDVAYAHYIDGIGTSKLTNVVLEKKLGSKVTGRNWNTVTKLLEMTKKQQQLIIGVALSGEPTGKGEYL